MTHHPIFFLMYNTTPAQLELTKEAFASLVAQDVGPLHLWVVDNGSNQETREWLNTLTVDSPHKLTIQHHPANISPLKIGNREAATLFSLGYEYMLSAPNDVVLPANFYRKVLEWPRGIVAASMTDDRNFPVSENVIAVNECTPMAVTLMRKWFYQAIVAKDGYLFDEEFELYGSDCDLALRMAACGIRGVQLSMAYYHFGSASHRLATPEISKEITSQADADRRYFELKWGFKVDDAEYGYACNNLNFRG